METFIPEQSAGVDCVVSAELLRRETMKDDRVSIALPLEKLFADIASFISISNFE